MKPIIEVEHLSKKYRYGESQQYYTLRDTLSGIFRAPFQLLKNKQQSDILKKDEFWALKDISFNLNQGEVLGIIGPNGSGKSTLLKILSRITPPTDGRAILRGRVGSLLEVGTGFQQELTGRENIYLNGAILGMRRWEINKKFDEIVDFSGVEKFLDTPVKHYSSGMYMRLAFAVAANLESEILVVDEVLAVGDIEFQTKCLGKMSEITSKEGRTILFVSHNLDAVRKLCTRCILLNGGAKIIEGPVENTLNKYNKMQKDLNIKTITSGNSNNHWGSGTLRFTKIEVSDKNNIRKNVFNINDTARFRISYEVYDKIEGLNIKIGLLSSKVSGLLLTDVRHRIESGVLKKNSKGSATIDIKLNSIRPGGYVLNFWMGDNAAIHQANPANYDVVEGLTKQLIVEAKSESEKNLGGNFSLSSKIVDQK